ncbi:MAG: K+/H+ antiporter subunit F [Betaproteobacteria bacterium]|nr:K+/H+ antiporter subunit F [Betaproteobacteria bacterium]
MLSFAVSFAVGTTSLALAIALWRLLRGPDAPDRILALDTLYIDAMALLLAMGIGVGHDVGYTGALLIALMGFVSTVALARYLASGDIID